MSDLNSFTFTGRLTQDASIRTLASGKKVLTANAAVNTGFGEYKKTLYIKVQQWGDRGENLIPYLKKGQLIGGQGEMSRSEWQNKEGKQYVDFVVDCLSIQLLGSKQQATSEDKEHAIDDIDDVVF